LWPPLPSGTGMSTVRKTNAMTERKTQANPDQSGSEMSLWQILQMALMLVLKLRTIIVLLLLILVFSYLSPVYLTKNNLIIMTKHVSINALLAIGMTFVILSAGIDLSVGSIVGLSAMIAGGLIVEGLKLPFFDVIIYFRPRVVLLLGLLVGAGVGLFNGIMITRLHITPFIATLGTLYMARGFALLRSDGNTFPNLKGNPELGNTGFEQLGGGRLLDVPVPIWIMLLFSLVALYILKRTPFGRHVYAVGGNEDAAELSGIPVDRVKLLVYMIAGFCSAMAGLIIASELQSSHPATGRTFELNAIAAVVLGGTSLMGGRGSLLGSIMGAFVIGFLSDGLVILGVSSFWQTVIKGAVIVIAVGIDEAQQRLQQRRALQSIEKKGGKQQVEAGA
jgi:erythritol transport system permease protein